MLVGVIVAGSLGSDSAENTRSVQAVREECEHCPEPKWQIK